ncbi:50S ribosomal protein L11 methyltransferase [Aquimarina sp. W85]|uniref:50S ribosomal protein L11 methyltransferase n=1 Tax=Aquimarina rhodophyticola TaxID=3342246 RepID=UPI003670A156
MIVPIYIGYYFNITPLAPASDILIAELGAAGFESFVETETGIEAYIQKEDWRENILEDIDILSSDVFEITYTHKEIEQVNWNLEWEKNFDPIIVDNLCSVRAPFHKQPSVKYDILIEPKMSFGTGHHETTHMMIQHILENDFTGKTVLDMGCGTGVLAILAQMRGAAAVDAIDIDNWCYINTLENVERNSVNNINVLEGDSTVLKQRKYDCIIANINRNILLKDIAIYAECLNQGGQLFLSGFYEEDLEMINKECKGNRLDLVSFKKRNNWIAASYLLK